MKVADDFMRPAAPRWSSGFSRPAGTSSGLCLGPPQPLCALRSLWRLRAAHVILRDAPALCALCCTFGLAS